MLFGISKLAGFLLQPSSLAAIALLSGLWLMGRGNRPVLARRLAWGSLGYYVLCGMLPVGNAIILPLEQRFAGGTAPKSSDGYKGIIILGGFEDGWVTAGRGQLTTNESAERLSEGTRLALLLPDAKVVFTGGSGALWRAGSEATGPIGAFLETMGVAKERIVLESESRDTYENARLSAGLLHPNAGERWLLVTSASHMPRAIGCFRKFGFDVRAYPVDYRTRGQEDLWRLFDRIPAGLQRTDLAVNEWLGLTAYYLSGRIDDFFPTP